MRYAWSEGAAHIDPGPALLLAAGGARARARTRKGAGAVASRGALAAPEQRLVGAKAPQGALVNAQAGRWRPRPSVARGDGAVSGVGWRPNGARGAREDRPRSPQRRRSDARAAKGCAAAVAPARPLGGARAAPADRPRGAQAALEGRQSAPNRGGARKRRRGAALDKKQKLKPHNEMQRP